VKQETTTTAESPMTGRKKGWMLWGIGVVGLILVGWLAYMHRPRTEMMEQLAALRAQGYGTSLAELAARTKTVPHTKNLPLELM
jgi:hypothetical protein